MALDHVPDAGAMTLRRPAALAGSRIDSWKGIAAFFGRDERTVKRWEKERSLPIHRLPGRRGGVFAYTDELTRWSHSTSIATPFDSQESNPGSLAIVGPHERTPASLRALPARISENLRGLFRKRVARRVVACGALAVIVAIGWTWAVGHASWSAARGPDISSARPQPSQSDAEEFYLRGSYYRNLRTRDGLARAVDAFTQAVVQNSNYAPAYAGLAESYILMPEFSSMRRSEAFPRAIAAANKAIALDPNLPQAHAALAFALFYWDWNVPRAFAEYQRALELDPHDADARHWYATSLLSAGNLHESLVQIKQAQQIDPASRSILADEALIQYSAGDRLAAIAQLREIEGEEPGFLSAPSYLSRLYLERGDYSAYLVEAKRVAAISDDPEDIAVADAAARGWSTGGSRQMLEQIRKVQLQYFQRHLSSGFDLARTCVLLGRTHEAVTYLQAAYADRDYRVMSISLDDWTAKLSEDPDFKQLWTTVRKSIDGGTDAAPATTNEPSSLAQSD
jgi:tetratricopeptide (TPR) repeat protein